jgi:D-alanyl-D-alanine carboxypeptidase (penicillin-binding protein 5/6)
LPTSKESDPVRGSKNAARKARAAFFCRFALAALALGFVSVLLYTAIRLRAEATPIASEAKIEAIAAYEKAHWGSIHPFPSARELHVWSWTGSGGTAYPSAEAVSLDLNARSAILVDASTGAILFEKDADELIPPASMTKLVAMYTAFHAIEKGELSLDDEIAPPPESWASNMPAGSSLMFLGPGQKLTVRELLAGMAVVSGNDAATALAITVAGSVDAFVARMNAEVADLGLEHTRFVEPTGLSEKNATTAREFADFALAYVRRYPDALRDFHSRESLSYPLERNLAGSRESPVDQEATNKLLGSLEGCDGLKTGFIWESGFNLALTANRNGNRFISVTMGGPGSTTAEGSAIRAKDGTLLMEWAFANFRTARTAAPKPVKVTVWKGDSGSIEAIPAGDGQFTVPVGALILPDGSNAEATIEYDVPRAMRSPVRAGDILGSVKYSLGGTVVHEVPLVADRTVHSARFARRALDHAAQAIARHLFRIAG